MTPGDVATFGGDQFYKTFKLLSALSRVPSEWVGDGRWAVGGGWLDGTGWDRTGQDFLLLGIKIFPSQELSLPDQTPPT